jgi:hypothetical protein
MLLVQSHGPAVFKYDLGVKLLSRQAAARAVNAQKSGTDENGHGKDI